MSLLHTSYQLFHFTGLHVVWKVWVYTRREKSFRPLRLYIACHGILMPNPSTEQTANERHVSQSGGGGKNFVPWLDNQIERRGLSKHGDLLSFTDKSRKGNANDKIYYCIIKGFKIWLYIYIHYKLFLIFACEIFHYPF